MIEIASQTRCILGEGAFWHPVRQSWFWCDILGQRLYELDGTRQRGWMFDRTISAMGWVDEDALLMATQTDLILFDLTTGHSERLMPLEAGDARTRSNDGRADPKGGFWIGTMTFDGDPGQGAIYRYFRGALRKLFGGISIPNAICFAPDGRTAFFTDTPTGVVRRVALDASGWPLGDPEPWLDLTAQGLMPDGAVVDAAGMFWNAQWGAGRVACYAPDGALVRVVDLPAAQTTCPAFGGPDLTQMLVTSAAEGREHEAQAGQTFLLSLDAPGQPEHQVLV